MRSWRSPPSGKCGLLLIDSIQTMQLGGSRSRAPGSLVQLRECTAALVRYAKASGAAVIIVGHVTKDGAIAGPKLLEHLVDTVLYFESDAASRYRMLRATKNRFGPVNELGFFAMSEGGLQEVRNPSAIFLSRHAEAGARQRRHGGARWRPAAADRGAGARGPQRASRAAPRGAGRGRQPALDAAGGPEPARRAAARRTMTCSSIWSGGIEIGETATDLPLALALASSLRVRALPVATGGLSASWG